MTEERQYLVGEDTLRNWRNRLATARRYPDAKEGTQKALTDVAEAIDSILASRDYQEQTKRAK